MKCSSPFLLILFFFVFNTHTYGQFYKQSQADSLKLALSEQEGKNRIHTLLHLAQCYYFIQLDSALSYASEAEMESKKQSYEWGVFKSKFYQTQVHGQTLHNKEVKKEIKECIRWFSEHQFDRDALRCRVFYLECLISDTPVADVEKYAASLLIQAKKMGDNALIGEIWILISHVQQLNIYTESIFLSSFDSALSLAPVINDSLFTIRLEIEKIRQKKYENWRQKSWEHLETLKRWNNRIHLSSLYNLITLFSGFPVTDSTKWANAKSNQVVGEYGSNVYQAAADFMIGFVYRLNDSIEKAVVYHKKSIKMNYELGALNNYYNDLKGLGTCYLLMDEHQKAIECFLKAIEQAKVLKHEAHITFTKSSLGNLYLVTKEYEKAENLFLEVLKFVRNDMSGRLRLKFLGRMHELLGKVDYATHTYDKALVHMDSSLFYFLKTDYLSSLRVAEMKLALFLDQNRIDSANAVYFFMNHNKKLASLRRRIEFYLQEGRLFLRQKKYSRAIQSINYYLKNVLLTYHSEDRLLANKILFQSHQALGNYKKALENHIEMMAVSDSIHQANTTENIALIQSKYELSEKEAELENTQQQRKIQELTLINQDTQIKKQKQNFILLLLLMVIIGSWGLFAFNRFRLRQKNKQLLLEVEKKKAAQQLEMAEIRSDFFTNVSHELRTPLTLLIGPLKKLLSETPKEFHGQIDRVYRNASQLNTIIDETLDLSKLKNGHLPLSCSKLDIVPFVEKVTQDFSTMAQHHNVTLEVKNTCSTLIVDFDKNKIKKVLVNLLGNAFKHTHSGDHIIVKIHTDEESTVIIEVKDTGKGIAKEHLPHLFDRFYQVDHNVKGSGVGLALSKQLIELHHGSISVTSEVGSGSCFSITLPIKNEHSTTFAEVELPVIENNTLTSAAVNFNDRKTILIIEDHDELRDYLKELLENEFTVLEAADGQEGIEIAAEKSPDLIISDVMMPHKDGFALTQYIKQHLPTSHIPIILLTAKASLDNKIKGLEIGADDYLGKPFDNQELLQRSKNLILQREKLRTLFSTNYFVAPQKVTQNKIDQQFLQQAIEIVEKNLENTDFTVDQFSKELLLNRTGVHLKLKALTGKNSSQFIKSIRIRNAAKLLNESAKSIGEICDICGFGSRDTFNKAFREQFNLTPTEFRNSEGLIPLKNDPI